MPLCAAFHKHPIRFPPVIWISQRPGTPVRTTRGSESSVGCSISSWGRISHRHTIMWAKNRQWEWEQQAERGANTGKNEKRRMESHRNHVDQQQASELAHLKQKSKSGPYWPGGWGWGYDRRMRAQHFLVMSPGKTGSVLLDGRPQAGLAGNNSGIGGWKRRD